MNEELDAVTLSVLIRPYKGRFVGMCAETGFVFEEETFDKIQHRLFSAIVSLLKEVERDPSLMPSLSLGLPFKYKIFFYRSALAFYFLKWWWNMRTIGSLIMQGNATQFYGIASANG